MTNDLTPFTDALLRRRSPDFYLGKVLLISDGVLPEGYIGGYYIPTGYNAQGHWDLHYCGQEQPPGEAIYKYERPGQDLAAIPSTVFTKEIRNSFWLWGIGCTVLFVLWAILAHDASVVVAFVIIYSMMVAPFIKWGMEIEPVSTMKILGVAMVVMLLWSHREQRTGNEVRNDQNNRMG